MTSGRHRRQRAWILAALLLTVTAGLLSRRHPLPGLLAEYPGDALYATAAFCLFALIRPCASGWQLASAAFGFACGIEFSQLLDLPWLREVRATRAGALLLGQGFQVADLLAYAVGALFGLCVDASWRALGASSPDVSAAPTGRSTAAPARRLRR